MVVAAHLPQTMLSATVPTRPAMSHNFYLKVDADGNEFVRHRRYIGGKGFGINALAAGFEMFEPTTSGQWKPIQLGKGGPPIGNQNAAKAAASSEGACSVWCVMGVAACLLATSGSGCVEANGGVWYDLSPTKLNYRTG